jgi:lipopolysaccharide export LptBFGC system permease protein LptF
MLIFALVLTVLIVGLAVAGVSMTSLIVPLLVLACPLMMFFMMRGMHGHSHGDKREHAVRSTDESQRDGHSMSEWR